MFIGILGMMPVLLGTNVIAIIVLPLSFGLIIFITKRSQSTVCGGVSKLLGIT